MGISFVFRATEAIRTFFPVAEQRARFRPLLAVVVVDIASTTKPTTPRVVSIPWPSYTIETIACFDERSTKLSNDRR
jgi:hypothetical protein